MYLPRVKSEVVDKNFRIPNHGSGAADQSLSFQHTEFTVERYYGEVIICLTAARN